VAINGPRWRPRHDTEAETSLASLFHLFPGRTQNAVGLSEAELQKPPTERYAGPPDAFY
jgi:hypothetical protein